MQACSTSETLPVGYELCGERNSVGHAMFQRFARWNQGVRLSSHFCLLHKRGESRNNTRGVTSRFNMKQVLYRLRDQYNQQCLSTDKKLKASLFFPTDKNLSLPFIAQEEKTTAPCRLLSTFSFFVFTVILNYMFKSWSNDRKAQSLLLFIVPCFCVSFPFGPPAAEVCGNNHPPTVCSLAASPALCMGLFMFLGTNNNLKEHSLVSLGMRRCETACRSWIGDGA